MDSWIKRSELTAHLKSVFRLDWHDIHGIKHWARVKRNGILLAQSEGGRTDVVEIFAMLHDHQRYNDFHDPFHGHRAYQAAELLNGQLFYLDQIGMALLKEAMEGHSGGILHGDITVQCCYDADRLDLGRCGITPDPRYLCTATAKDPNFLAAAYDRSRQGE